MLKRFLIPFLFILSPSALSAQAPAIDTLYFVERNGMVMTTQGHVISIDFAEDGVFEGEAAGTAFSGSYRVDGAQLCTTSALAPAETCTAYPEGMRPGDEFDVVSPALGNIRIRIRTPEENRAAAAGN